ncbi:MAG: hypothetical protein HQL52_15295 [Magnetococcales bacterium]|nr:hypothetical protein [Magnetococcales bacterium]
MHPACFGHGTTMTALARYLPDRQTAASPWFLLVVAILFGGSRYLIPDPIYYVLTVVSVLLLVSCLLFPMVGLYLYVLVAQVQQTYYFMDWTKFYDLRVYPYIPFVIVAGVGLVAYRSVRQKGIDRRTPLDTLWLFIIVFEGFSLFWAPNLTFGIYLWCMLVVNYISYLLFTHLVLDHRQLKLLVSFTLFCGFLGAVSIFGNLYYDIDKYFYWPNDTGLRAAFTNLYGRPGGWSGPSHLSGFMAATIPIAYIKFGFAKEGIKKFFYLAIMVFMMGAIVMGETRGVFISLFGGLFFLLYISPQYAGKRLFYGFLSVSVIVATMIFFQPRFINRILVGFGYTGQLFLEGNKGTFGSGTEEGQGPEGQSGLTVRIWWFTNVLKAMNKEPLTYLVGPGLSGFQFYSRGSPEANGLFWGFIADMGVLGLILFIFFVKIVWANTAYYVRKAQHTKSYYLYLAVLTGFVMDVAIHGLVDFDLNSYGSKNIWLPMGLLMATMNILRREMDAEESEKTIPNK